MSFVIGTRHYGYVDQLPGVGYVTTQFFHINFVPLIPVKTFFVVAGSESGGEFRGIEIGMSGKSVLAGYLRGWGTWAALIAGGIGWYHGAAAVSRADPVGIAGAVAAVILVLVAALVWNKFWLVGQAGFHVVSAALFVWAVFAKGTPAWVLGVLGVANVALVVVALTRLMDRAGWGRAVQLLDQMGHDRETAEEIADELFGARRRTWQQDS